jgi:hypothetical protein
MKSSSDPKASLINKLEEFSAGLSPEEGELLGELLVHSYAPTVSAAEAPGLAKTISTAVDAGKTRTRLHLEVSPDNVTLAMAGPVQAL